jgi:hypothetical protein
MSCLGREVIPWEQADNLCVRLQVFAAVVRVIKIKVL